MIQLYINSPKRQYLAVGHAPDYVCSAITAFMRAYGAIASRAVFRDGLSLVEVNEGWDIDCAAIEFALEAFAAKSVEVEIKYVDDSVIEVYKSALTLTNSRSG